MKVGDLVHNVPYNKYGMIIEELEPITGDDGVVAEQRLVVLYDDGDVTLTGSTFLKKIEKNLT
ncbi:MAG TPA: hypothetical protein EYF95_04125 [Flavobacteriales bacterium]|jgi:hypothetical protein|nr:hypothetical protein [Flavobacteriales bacterium]